MNYLHEMDIHEITEDKIKEIGDDLFNIDEDAQELFDQYIHDLKIDKVKYLKAKIDFGVLGRYE